MPRNSGIYSIPLGTEGVPDTTIESEPYNIFLSDVEFDLNFPRPVIAGGTGATEAFGACENLKALHQKIEYTNFDTAAAFSNGGFYALGSSVGGPVGAHRTVGLHLSTVEPANGSGVQLTYDLDAPDGSNPLYYRHYKSGGPWSAWRGLNADYVLKSGDTITGSLSIQNNLGVGGTFGVSGAVTAGSTITASGDINTSADISAQDIVSATVKAGVVYAANSTTFYMSETAGVRLLSFFEPWGFRFTSATGVLTWSNATEALMAFNSDGQFETKGKITAAGLTSKQDVVIYRESTPTVGVLYFGSALGANVQYNGTIFQFTHQVAAPSLNIAGAATCASLAASGAITGGTVTTTGAIKGNVIYPVSAATDFFLTESGGYRMLLFSGNWGFRYENATGDIRMNNHLGALNHQFYANGNLYIAGPTAYKAGAGQWADGSDARIKNVKGEYNRGLEAILKLRPVRYTFKGNDAPEADAPSWHSAEAERGKEFVGMIAQEVEPVLPGLISKRRAFIDGKAVDDLRDLDPSELIYTLVNAVKQLADRVEELENAQGVT